MKTMFKLINSKTIGTTAVSIALLAGTLVTPAFAKGTAGYIKPTETNNRQKTSLVAIERMIFDTHGNRINFSKIDLFRARSGGSHHFDLLFFDQEPKSWSDGTGGN